MVVTVSTVRNLRLRKFEMPNDTAAAVALNRPISASCTPDAARLRRATARVKRPKIMPNAVAPIAKITKDKKIM